MSVRSHQHTSAAVFMTGALLSFIFTIMFIIEIGNTSGEKQAKYIKDVIISASIFIACSFFAYIENRRGIINV